VEPAGLQRLKMLYQGPSLATFATSRKGLRDHADENRTKIGEPTATQSPLGRAPWGGRSVDPSP
jgi:hypothetical protein